MRTTFFFGMMRIGRANSLASGLAIIFAPVLLFGLQAANPAHAVTQPPFTVNSTGDGNDSDFPGGTFDGSSDGQCDEGTSLCTLRAAIQEANVTAGADTIEFNIPDTDTGCDAGVCTISPPSALPLITDPVIIDGYSQPGAKANTLAVGNDAVLKIELKGPDALNGLKIEADDSTVQGLVINNWDNGIWNFSSDPFHDPVTNVRLEGNYIGTDATGTVTDPDGIPNNGDELGNNIGVALTNAVNNTIGGTAADKHNIISGNGAGISISGGMGNRMQGNYIGTDASGTQRLGNFQGVNLSNAPNNTIGGTTAAARNIISGNSTWGIHITDAESTGNKVEGNYIGTDVTGAVTDPDNIPNNGDELGNLFNGVSIGTGAANNTIGGTKAAAGNVISGNGYNSNPDNSFTKSGVEVKFDNSDAPNKATGNSILSNSIYHNARLGIDLYYTNDLPGVTCNDLAPPPDNDTGPNNLQNFPEITSAKLTTKRIGGHRRKITIIKGTLNSTPSTATATQAFTLQFFGSPEADDTPSTCGSSGFGEGKTFLGQKSVNTNKDGVATFTFQTRKKVPKGQVVTATATNQVTSDTSEFSEAMPVS